MILRRIGYVALFVILASVALASLQLLRRPSQAISNNPATPPAGKNTKKQAHVVVVGAGISGLSAALELGRGGAHVTLVDMSSVYGGHAVMSQGGVSIVRTPLQKSEGIEDSPELAFQDFVNWGEDVNTEWVRYYVENSKRDIYDWLIETGVRFHEVATAPGNTVHRDHQPLGRGIGLVTPIYRCCLELENIQFVWNSKVEKLLVDNKKVVGVLARNLRNDTEKQFRAEYVVLATGGFQSNLEMVREFWPAEFRFPERILYGSGRNSVGHGHTMAQAVGADLFKMDHQWNYFTGIPDPLLPESNHGLSAANMWGIIVNKQGQRFANVLGWAKEVMPPLLSQNPATLWFIFDEASKPHFVISGSDWADFSRVERLVLNNPKLVKTADTLEELAKKWDLPPDALAETVRHYNDMVEQGVDSDFNRFGPRAAAPQEAKDMSPKIMTPPYYAMQAFPLTRKSMGGIAIDLECRVLDKKQKTIPGLYAVGECAGLAGINGSAALEGTFLGPCVVTGRVAARSILGKLHVTENDIPPEVDSCLDCHDIEDDLANPREGYWHFENVHRVVLKRQIDCRHCHAELTPYNEDNHRINHQSLASMCIQCHLAQE